MLEALGIVLDIAQIVLTAVVVVLLYKKVKEDNDEE